MKDIPEVLSKQKSLDSCRRRPASEEGTGWPFTVPVLKSVAHTLVHAVCDLVVYFNVVFHLPQSEK